MKINIIKVPVMYGSSKDGVEYGPRKIMEMGLLDHIKRFNLEIGEVKEIYIPIASTANSLDAHPNIKYYEENLKINYDLATTVEQYNSEDCTTLILGGDHVLGLGSVLGAMQSAENLGVIWVDAHCDINTELTTPTKNAHGMPLAFAMGLGDKNFANLYKNKKLNPKNTFIVGARDIDEGEYIICEEQSVNLYDMPTICEKSLNKVIFDIFSKIESNQIDKIHLSIDVDSLDSALVPGTGTPVKGGFTMEELKFIIRSIIQSNKVATIDVVELNPRLDVNNKTAQQTNEIMITILEALKEVNL